MDEKIDHQFQKGANIFLCHGAKWTVWEISTNNQTLDKKHHNNKHMVGSGQFAMAQHKPTLLVLR